MSKYMHTIYLYIQIRDKISRLGKNVCIYILVNKRDCIMYINNS